MNLPNAFVFASLGWIMEMIPKAFPSWFPHTGSDGANSRALWLALMGVFQMALGIGFIVRVHVVPVVVRLVALVPSGETAALPLASHRGITLR
jgi:hypothetical protein